MSMANNVYLCNGKIIFYNNHAIHSTVSSNNYKYVVFSDSLNTIGNVDIGKRLSVTGQSDFVGPVTFNSSKDSDSCNYGAVTFKGGVAIKKKLNIGGSFNIEGSINFTNNNIIASTISTDTNGNINMNNKCIINVLEPIRKSDVTNKKYVDTKIEDVDNKMSWLSYTDKINNKGINNVTSRNIIKTNVILTNIDNYVGIGTDSPTEKLDVVGNIAVSGNVDGRDIFVDGTTLDTHIGATNNVHGILGDILGTTDAQTLTNKIINSDDNTITNITNTDVKALAAIDATKIANGSVNNTEFQYLSGTTNNIQTQINNHNSDTKTHGVTGNIVGTTDTQTLTNKIINSDGNTITNIVNSDIKALASIDATKIANGSVTNTEFQYLDGVTNNIQTQIDNHSNNTNAHGVIGNIVGTTDIQILSNKNLVDSNTYIVNNTNQTKKLKFSLNGADPNKTMTFNFIHTGNRVITIPDTTDTLVTTSLSQILNNKTLISTSNDITANKLRSFDGSSITINNTAVPSAGQVLTATSATTAKWQNNSSNNTIAITLVAGQAMAIDTTYTSIACMPWLDARYNNYTNGTIILHVNIVNRDLFVRLQDITNNVTLGELIITSTGSNSSSSNLFTVINPSSDAQIELQIKKSISGGINPRIYGILLEYNII